MATEQGDSIATTEHRDNSDGAGGPVRRMARRSAGTMWTRAARLEDMTREQLIELVRECQAVNEQLALGAARRR